MTDFPSEVVEKVEQKLCEFYNGQTSVFYAEEAARYLLSIVGPLVEALKNIEAAVHEKALSQGITHDTSCGKAYWWVQAALSHPALKEMGLINQKEDSSE